MRHTLRIIATRDVYARSSNNQSQKSELEQWYGASTSKSLLPEVLLDAIEDVLDSPVTNHDHSRQRAITWLDPTHASPDGGHLLVAGGSPGEFGVVQLRRWPALDLVHSWREHQDVVYKTAWRSDGKEWVSASLDGYCRVCLPNAEASHVKMTSHSGPAFAATYLSDGSVATAGGDGTIVVWNSSSGQSTRVLRQHTRSVHALALQPASEGGWERLLASASEDRTIRFWQPDIGRMVRFHRFSSVPRSIAWTLDGSLVDCRLRCRGHRTTRSCHTCEHGTITTRGKRA